MPPATYYGNPFPGNPANYKRGGLPPSLAPTFLKNSSCKISFPAL